MSDPTGRLTTYAELAAVLDALPCAGCGARQGETGEVWENKGGPEGASTPTDPNRPTRITEQRG